MQLSLEQPDNMTEQVYINETFDAMALDNVQQQFSSHEFMAIAMKSSDRAGVSLYTLDDSMEHLHSRFKADDPAALTKAICDELNMPVEQIRHEISQDEELTTRVTALHEAHDAIVQKKEAREKELEMFSEGVQQQLDEIDNDLELEKANVLNALAQTSLRKSKERLATLRIPKISGKGK